MTASTNLSEGKGTFRKDMDIFGSVKAYLRSSSYLELTGTLTKVLKELLIVPDIACKAVFVVRLPPGFLILLWDVHAASLAIYFLKFSLPKPLSPAPGGWHLFPPRDFGTGSRRGEGAGDFVPSTRPCPGNFLWPFLTDKPTSSAGRADTHRHGPRPSPRPERGTQRPAAHRAPAGGRPRSPRSPSSGPAAESPDVGFNPYSRSFISIKGQRHGGAEIAAPRAPPASPARLPPPPRAPPRPHPAPARESARPLARGAAAGDSGGGGEAVRPARDCSSGRRRREQARPARAVRLRGRGERGGALGGRLGAATTGLH
ncbi:translation initiation factor IF-2-like [Panthera uncia]|uniref:translation initiation factor IF-2-like n=1 Tax=Panthera uncia TaxID=29064 RepID=UPI0020FF8A3A|nr:translation initiation factor IF-2-like [Panthera uncia]